VHTEVLTGIPDWLTLGVGIGFLLSCGAACLFYVGDRLFPSTQPDRPNLAGDPRRATEIRQYLSHIEEPYSEDVSIAGQTVEFYLPNRDVAISFDPRVFYAVGRSSTHAVLVEHEMPGMQLGARLPFKTPEVDFEPEETTDAEPERPPGDGAYAVLGLSAEATDTEVRRAYREKIKEVHPDHGGSHDEFQQVQEAYTAARSQGEI
jgi:hypothetical protein